MRAYGGVNATLATAAHSLAAEIPAWLGSGMHDSPGLNRAQAIEVLGHYFDLLKARHGETSVIRQRIMPDLRKDLPHD